MSVQKFNNILNSGGATGDRRLKVEALPLDGKGSERGGSGGGALTEHAEAGWEGAPHNWQERDARAVKMRLASVND